MTRVQKARARQGPLPTPPTDPPTKHAGRIRIFIGLAVLIAAFTAFVTPGFAEFESGETGDTGKGEVFIATLTEGPTTITCEAEANASKVGWTVEKEGKEAKKAGGLRVKFEKWGTCTYVAAGGQEGTAELKGCEVETEEGGEEAKEPVKLVACTTVLSGECEIKLPEQKRENIEIRGGGEADENTEFNLNSTSINAEVSKACASFGVQASKTVNFVAKGELDSVKTAAPNLKFSPETKGIENKFAENTNNGVGEQVFKFEDNNNKLEIKCSTSKFEGNLQKDTTQIKIIPAYSNCGAGNSVTLPKCQYIYLLHDHTNVVGEFDGYGAIGNNGSCEMLFQSSTGCEISVVAQPKQLAMYYSNILGSPTELITIFGFVGGQGMTATVKKACNGLSTGTIIGEYRGEAKLKHLNVIE
jgi:hypothetical protein